MLRASTGLLRASAKAGKWQQCMKLSTTNIVNSASAATPEPQTNPPILYTGVSFCFKNLRCEKLKLTWFRSFHTQLFINNEWYKSKSGEIFPTINPTNGQTIAQIQAAGKEDVDIAVAAAREAFKWVTHVWFDHTAQTDRVLCYTLCNLFYWQTWFTMASHGCIWTWSVDIQISRFDWTWSYLFGGMKNFS